MITYVYICTHLYTLNLERGVSPGCIFFRCQGALSGLAILGVRHWPLACLRGIFHGTFRMRAAPSAA